MKTLRDAINAIIFVVLVAFIANSLLRLLLFYLHGNPTP
jgi:hypothetical protein